MLLISSTVLLACSTAKPALVNFNDSSQWTPHTEGSGATAQTINNGNGIQINWAAGADVNSHVYYRSTFALSGDWTVEFNYTLDSWPANNGVFLGVDIIPFVGMHRYSSSIYSGAERYGFSNGPLTPISTTDMSGRIQLSMRGSTLTGSYWNPVSQLWIVVGEAHNYSGPDGPWPSTGPFQITVGSSRSPSSNGGALVAATISDVVLETQFTCTPRTATATAALVNGFIVGAAITDAGCGYTNAPTVLIKGGGGSGATATAVVSNGVVTAINITCAGIGYTNTPNIFISPPLAPQGALVKAVKPSFSNLSPGFNYQLQISGDLNTWTNHGSIFEATNSSMLYPEYFDVGDWGNRYFRVQIAL